MAQNQKKVISRGLFHVYYSTTSGMSKQFANKFQSCLEIIGFSAPVINVGDIDPEQFLNYEGTIVMFLSTYGNGDSPNDGQRFLDWIQNFKSERALKNLSFIIMAFGNSSFQNFCGHGRRMTQCLISNGATMLMETRKCDANVESENASKVFDGWSQKVLDLLTLKYPLKELPLKMLTGGYSVEIKKEKINWEDQLAKRQFNLGKQFSNYVNAFKAQVIHIEQLRMDTHYSERSTLWVRIKKPQQLILCPGSNINIYPQNLVRPNQFEENHTIKFIPKKPYSKVPFPPMTILDLKRLVNLRQKTSNKLVKNAILLSDRLQQVKEKYRKILSENKIEQINCEKLLSDLEPRYEFYAELGVNSPRVYTLASWDPKNQYIDLCISTIKEGLTSNYLKAMPKTLKINSSQSAFIVPTKPLIMIANGSGVAPFRSIVEYMAHQSKQNRISLKLYYGIQNLETDFYFKDDFEKYEKEGIVQIKIAQSRKNPNHKQYIQELIEQDKQLIREHLFKKEGRIYICGGRQMEKAVNASIFKAITLQCKIPYKGFTILHGFKAQKIIVEEVFG